MWLTIRKKYSILFMMGKCISDKGPAGRKEKVVYVKKKRFLAILSAVCLALPCLTGCADSPAAPSEGEGATLTLAQQQATVHRSSQSDISAYITYVRAWGQKDGQVWGWGTAVEDPAQQEPLQESIYLAYTDDAGAYQSKAAFTLPEAPAAKQQVVWQQVGGLFFTQNGILCALLEQRFVATRADGSYEPEDLSAPLEQKLTLCQVKAGTLQPQVELQLPQLQGAAAIQPGCCFFLADGSFWAALFEEGPMKSHLAHFGADGSLLAAIPLDGALMGLGGVEGDSAVFHLVEEQGLAYYLLEGLTAKTPTVTRLQLPEIETQQPALFPYLRDGEGQLCILAGDTLWRLDDQGSPTALLQLADYGVSQSGAQLQWAGYLRSGDLLVIATQADGRYEYHLLDPAGVDVSDRQLLTVAGCGVFGQGGSIEGRVQQVVRQFNYQQNEVFVELADYADTACAALGYGSVLERLQRDLVDKTVPDVLLMAQQPELKGLQRNGFFADLYTYLDADGELQRADFLPNILQMCEFDGALTTIPVSYEIQTAVGVPAVVGDKPGWTWAEYDALIAAAPQLERSLFCVYPPSHLVLHYLRWGGDKFLDYENGVCHLDTPEFIRLLEDCAALPDYTPESEDTSLAMHDGRILAKLERVFNFYSLRPLLYEFVDGFGHALDDGFVFKGLPSDGDNGSCVIPQLQVAISAACADQDAAWQFVRQFLLPSFQTVQPAAAADGFPSRKDSLQQLAADCAQPMSAPYGGYRPGYMAYESYKQTIDYWRQGIPAEYVQMTLELVEATTAYYQDDAALDDILLEELDIYFSGARSAADTAAVLQDRIGTYLQEQM